jgi:hypothetical protein
VLLLVAFDAAAFDASHSEIGTPANIPRIHERYLIYLVPLFLIAFAAVLRTSRRIPVSAYVAAATAAALLPLTIPFGMMVNNSIVADSFSMEAFARSGAVYVAISHARLVALGFGALLGASLVAAAWRPWGWTASVVMTIVAFLYVSNLLHTRLYLSSNGAVHGGVPARHDWVDHATDGKAAVLVAGGGGGAQGLGELESVFFNLSITRVYHTCGAFLGADFGDRLAAVDPASGSLDDVEGGTGTILTGYAVVPTQFDVPGTVLARDKRAGLELIAPATDTLVIPGLGRSAACALGKS